MNKLNLNSRKQVVILTFVIAMILVVLVDSSYAWYVVTNTSDKTVGIKAGTLNLTFDKEESESIVLTNLTPVSESDGLSSGGYTFKIKNTGSISSDYTVYLNDLDLSSGEERLDDKYVKYDIESDSVDLSNNFLNTLNDNILVTGSIAKDEEKIFTLRLWLDEDAFNKDATNKVLKKTIKISATQTEK